LTTELQRFILRYLRIYRDSPWIYIADSCPQSRAAPLMRTQ